MSTKYDIEVELVGQDGNAMSIIAKVSSALKRNDVPTEEITANIVPNWRGNQTSNKP